MRFGREVGIVVRDSGQQAVCPKHPLRLLLNCVTSPSGEIRAQLTDETALPIEGYTFADCDPVAGDQLQVAVTWGGRSQIDISPLKPLVVQFELTQAKLFALYTEER